MTERDLGSTFLLPHTHLYKPDRVSQIIIHYHILFETVGFPIHINQHNKFEITKRQILTLILKITKVLR